MKFLDGVLAVAAAFAAKGYSVLLGTVRHYHPQFGRRLALVQ
jgi:hypothetical protein